MIYLDLYLYTEIDHESGFVTTEKKGVMMLKAVKTFYWWLGILNDFLLIPMFALIVLEIGQQDARHFATDAQDIALNLCFFTEWLLGLILASDRKKYVFTFSKILDFISCLPFGTFSQSLRLARISRVLKLIRFVTRAKRYKGPGEELLRVAALVGATIFAGAYSILVVEPNHSQIEGISEALWWSLVTVSTVGYGDMYPETTAGRLVAAPLIVVGVGVCGYIAGFMARVMSTDKDEENASIERQQLQEITDLLNTVLEMKDSIESRLERIEEKIEKSDG